MKKEPLEIPNTDYVAVKGEGYIEVYDGDIRLATLPPHWTLFDIELWCAGYSIGRAQGIQAGRIYGEREAQGKIMDAFGVTRELEVIRREAENGRK